MRFGKQIAFIALASLILSACGSCLDPWTKLSDCPGGTPGHHKQLKE